MAGVAAVSIAFLLGCLGPKLLWRGVAWLLLSVLVAGSSATVELAYMASADGMEFAITPQSILVGLSEQVLIASVCYALGTIVAIGGRRIRRPRPKIAATGAPSRPEP